MSSLQPNLVPYVQSTQRQDLIGDPEAFAVFLHHAVKFFNPDFEEVTFSGYLDDNPRSEMRVSVVLGSRIVRSITCECAYAGYLEIRTESISALGRDMLGSIESAWLEANHFAPNHPCNTEAEVKGTDIEISIYPCI